MTTGPDLPTTPAPAKKPSKVGGFFSTSFIVILLLIGFASGGYYFGTQARFHNLSSPPGEGYPDLAMFFPKVKNWYWVHTKGTERAGYVITVLINGQLVGKFHKPNLNIDVTPYVRPGRNKLSFSAKSLPIGQRDTSNNTGSLSIELRSSQRKLAQPLKFEGGDMLVEYTRRVTETENFNEVKEFETIE